MNRIVKYFKRKKQEKKYKEELHDHKIFILQAFYEMLNCKELEDIMYAEEIMLPLWMRALDHDDSKYDKEEFDAYRKNFFPVDIQEKRFNELAFEKAWQHHIQMNDHHWQHRQNDEDKELDTETKLACLENVMDWLARGYQFKNRPYQYYENHKDGITLPSKQKEFIEYLIYEGIDKRR